MLMLSKRYESTEVDRRTWLNVPSGTLWSTSSDTRQVSEVVEIYKEIKMYTPFLFKLDSTSNIDHMRDVATLIVKITLNVKNFTLRVNDPPLM